MMITDMDNWCECLCIDCIKHEHKHYRMVVSKSIDNGEPTFNNVTSLVKCENDN